MNEKDSHNIIIMRQCQRTIEIKERELQQKQQQLDLKQKKLEASEHLVAEFQDSLQQKDNNNTATSQDGTASG